MNFLYFIHNANSGQVYSSMCMELESGSASLPYNDILMVLQWGKGLHLIGKVNLLNGALTKWNTVRLLRS